MRIRTPLPALAALLLLLVAAGCKGNGQSVTSGATTSGTNQPSSASAAAPATSPEELGALGAQIKKQPNDAHQLLLQHGLDEQSFAAAIRKVSEDPAAAKRYAAAYRQASS